MSGSERPPLTAGAALAFVATLIGVVIVVALSASGGDDPAPKAKPAPAPRVIGPAAPARGYRTPERAARTFLAALAVYESGRAEAAAPAIRQSATDDLAQALLEQPVRSPRPRSPRRLVSVAVTRRGRGEALARGVARYPSGRRVKVGARLTGKEGRWLVAAYLPSGVLETDTPSR